MDKDSSAKGGDATCCGVQHHWDTLNKLVILHHEAGLGLWELAAQPVSEGSIV